MSDVQEPFTVSYCGVSVMVTPVVKEMDMQYKVNLPTREVLIETVEDDNEISIWVEVPGGRTGVAQELGELIEKKFL